MNVFTIGFTQKSAEDFFESIRRSGVKKILDVRLNNTSQLSGFAKKDDLAYFLKKMLDVDYIHVPLLVPTKLMLDDYKKKNGDWSTYESKFINLMKERSIEKKVPKDLLRDACLLCSENKPHNCHRRLVVEYLKSSWGDMKINHL